MAVPSPKRWPRRPLRPPENIAVGSSASLGSGCWPFGPPPAFALACGFLLAIVEGSRESAEAGREGDGGDGDVDDDATKGNVGVVVVVVAERPLQPQQQRLVVVVVAVAVVLLLPPPEPLPVALPSGAFGRPRFPRCSKQPSYTGSSS